MSIETYQGVVKNGQIRLSIEVKLPENSEVVVIVPKKEKEKQKFDLAEMAKQMPKDYQLNEEDFGKPVGKEVW